MAATGSKAGKVPDYMQKMFSQSGVPEVRRGAESLQYAEGIKAKERYGHKDADAVTFRYRGQQATCQHMVNI